MNLLAKSFIGEPYSPSIEVTICSGTEDVVRLWSIVLAGFRWAEFPEAIEHYPSLGARR